MNGFNFTLPYEVMVSDVNYGGHVSNAAVLNYFHDARISFLRNLGPFSEFDIGQGCGVIMVEAHVRYLKQMFLGDNLSIGAAMEELKKTSFTLRYRIERDDAPVAEGTTRLAAFDYKTGRPQRIPECFANAIQKLEALEPLK